jgi:hypothetical protein
VGRGCRTLTATVVAVCGLLVHVSASADAVTIGPPPVPAPSYGDGRVDEQVSPVAKSGAAGFAVGAVNAGPLYAVASPDGDAVLYTVSGPVGSTASGIELYATSRRTGSGWTTTATIPRPSFQLSAFNGQPLALYPSTDLSAALFTAAGSFVTGDPDVTEAGSVYLAQEGGSLAWLGRPTVTGAESPDPLLGEVAVPYNIVVSGGSPGLTRVYLAYYGTLTPEDRSRAEVLAGEGGANETTNPDWGFYEWTSGGGLKDAGVLPSDSPLYPDQPSPYGAVPAATINSSVYTPDDFDNQVSADGSLAYFVSPDPTAAHPSSEPPELYVRENGSTTLLVSKSEITGGSAATGPLEVDNPDRSTQTGSYVFASRDGSRAFFASADRLTVSAPETSEAKEYVFDAQTGAVTYLPGVTAPLVATSGDGRRFLFLDRATTPETLDFGELGEGGGVATRVLSALPEPAPTETNFGGQLYVDPARATEDGSVFAFETDSPLPGFPNNGGGFDQVYRYDVAGDELTCVSCPPTGVTPTGDAHLSNDSREEHRLLGSRGLSSDGSRIFFDTPDPLVPEDTNGKRDVYAWEGGKVQLISSGRGSLDSYFLDNSESGNDVFFATADALAEGDTDGNYDVYDARAGGGFPGPTELAPCTSGCQSGSGQPPGQPPLVTAVAGPSGNLVAPAAPPPSKRTKAHQPKKKNRKKRARRRKRRAGRSATHGKLGSPTGVRR